MKLRLSPKANAELLGVVGDGMPHDARQYWYTTVELQAMLKESGLPLLPEKAVSNAFRANQQNSQGVDSRKHNNKRYYCFERDPDRRKFDAPKAQLEKLREAGRDEGEVQHNFFVTDAERRGRVIPAIPENHFANCSELHHLREFAEREPSPADDPALDDARDDTSPQRIATAPARDTARVTPPSENGGRGIAIDGGDTAPKAAGGKSHVPCRRADAKAGGPLSTGIVLMDLDGMDEFQRDVIEKHARRCPAGSLTVVRQVKEGYDLDRTYFCRFCKESYQMSTGPSTGETANNAEKKRGRDMRPINKMMSTAIFNAGAPAKQVQELFIDAGAVCPSERGLGNMLDKVKGERPCTLIFFCGAMLTIILFCNSYCRSCRNCI